MIHKIIHEQPAQISYFLYGGFIDLKKVISGAFKRIGDVTSRCSDGLGKYFNEFIDDLKEIWGELGLTTKSFLVWRSIFMVMFYLVQLIAAAIVTPLICFFITAFQITIMFVLLTLELTWFGFIFLLDKIYCTYKAISSHCPICQVNFSLPLYICSSCGIEHDRLRPGVYGILKRKCNCGEKLSTTFLNGRQKLVAKCGHCKYDIKEGGLRASWCIPVVGGPSSGKTCYINMTMMSLEKEAFSKYGLHFEHEKNGLDEYEENTNLLSRGVLPQKTTDHRLRYYQFTLTPSGATKQQISLCDVAGELFDVTSSNAINTQIGFRYANAFILIIDPLSIPEYRNEVSKAVSLNEYKHSPQRIDEMLDTFVRTLQNMFSIDAKTMLNTDVAVVFTKGDIPGLDEKIGESAVLKNAQNLKPKIKYETQNNLCEQFLREYNEDSFLNNLKSRFKSRQFFVCSALGHAENGQPFAASKNVEEPFFWLLKKKSRVIAKAIK